MKKDWNGNSQSVFVNNGDSNHSEKERANLDYYATPPEMAIELIKLEPELNNIWEPACGEGHLAKVFEEKGILGKATDIINRGYGKTQDFLLCYDIWNGDIVTNPPYNQAQEFVEHALNLINENNKVCMFLKLTFLEGKKRKRLFEKKCLKHVYISTSRVNCACNGEFNDKTSSAVAYAWFVFEKGYIGDPIIKWFN